MNPILVTAFWDEENLPKGAEYARAVGYEGLFKNLWVLSGLARGRDHPLVAPTFAVLDGLSPVACAT